MRRFRSAREATQRNREPVATETRDDILRADASLEDARNLHEQVVRRSRSQAIRHVFEMIDVDENDDKPRSGVLLSTTQRPLYEIVKRFPCWKMGDGIPSGLPLDRPAVRGTPVIATREPCLARQL